MNYSENHTETALAQPGLPRPPDPTPEMLESEEFEVVWNIIKTWDVDHGGGMRSGATGNDAAHIVNELRTLHSDQLSQLQLERDSAKADAERWIQRLELLEARLDKIRELLGADPRTDPVEISGQMPPGIAALSMLREAHRQAPPPFLPMPKWTLEDKSAAADFYHLAYDFLPALLYSARAYRGSRIRKELTSLIADVRSQGRDATAEELIAVLGIAETHAQEAEP